MPIRLSFPFTVSGDEVVRTQHRHAAAQPSRNGLQNGGLAACRWCADRQDQQKCSFGPARAGAGDIFVAIAILGRCHL
jgi:hypothetical protein